jgi:hypothetical protein
MKGNLVRNDWASLLAAMAVVAAILLFPVFAQQAVVPVKPVTDGRLILPPPEYDHVYQGDLTIVMVKTVDELLILCNTPHLPNTLACSIRAYDGKSCVIIMVDDDVMRRRAWTTGLLLRHEMGHCNGWTQAHEGLRSVESNSYWVPDTQRIRLPAERWQRQLTKQWENLCEAAPKGPRLGRQ